MNDLIREPARRVLEGCRRGGLRLAVAESCTGGLIAASLTAIPGASEVLDRAFVTYSNQAKIDLLGVAEPLLARRGAVSEEVARAMAEGALQRAPVDVTVAVTGIAGPGGGSREKPVGLVHLAAARRERTPVHERHLFSGGRDAIRRAATERALRLLLGMIG